MQPLTRRRLREPAESSEFDGAAPPRRAYRRAPETRFTVERILRLLFGLALGAAALWTLWFFGTLVVYLLVGVVLSSVMRPLVDRLEGAGTGRIPAILVAFVVVVGVISVLLTQLVPFAAQQLSGLSQQFSFETAGRITAIDPEGPAAEAGLERGEVIVAIDGETWQNYDQLQAVLGSRKAGDRVTLIVEAEDGRRRPVAVTLRPAPEKTEETGEAFEDTRMRRIAVLGVTTREVAFSGVATAIERRLEGVLPIRPGAVGEVLTTAADRLLREERLAQFAGSLVGLFTDLFYAVIIVPFVAFFFLKDGLRIRRAMLRLVPNRFYEITISIVEKIESIVGRYIVALLIQCGSVAAVASALLYLAGLDYALTVGIFTGVANTIPYLGPAMGFLAGTLVGVVQTGDFALLPGVLIAMTATQVIDNLFFQPLIFSRAARMHPLVILFAVLVGAQLAGIVGMLVAIPVTTMLRVVGEQVLWSLRNYRILQSAG